MTNNKNKRYAVPTINGELCLHFGHCQHFAIIDIDMESSTISNSEMKTPPPHEPGILPQWLHEQGVAIVLAGGMGGRAQQIFRQHGIEVVTGATTGLPDKLVIAHAKGELETGDNVCSH